VIKLGVPQLARNSNARTLFAGKCPNGRHPKCLSEQKTRIFSSKLPELHNEIARIVYSIYELLGQTKKRGGMRATALHTRLPTQTGARRQGRSKGARVFIRVCASMLLPHACTLCALTPYTERVYSPPESTTPHPTAPTPGSHPAAAIMDVRSNCATGKRSIRLRTISGNFSAYVLQSPDSNSC
jgi:hypothetical protein